MAEPATGRIVVDVGRGTVALHLQHWNLKPSATLTLAEVDELVTKLLDAAARAEKPRTFAGMRVVENPALKDGEFAIVLPLPDIL